MPRSCLAACGFDRFGGLLQVLCFFSSFFIN